MWLLHVEKCQTVNKMMLRKCQKETLQKIDTLEMHMMLVCASLSFYIETLSKISVVYNFSFCHFRKSNGFVNPQPPSRTIEPLEDLQGVMRVKPQKPITRAIPRIPNPSSHVTSKESHASLSSIDCVSLPKVVNVPSSTDSNACSFLPMLPKSPVSISFPSTTNISQASSTIKESTNSLTITPTVIFSTRNNSNVVKRKRTNKSADSNSEV